MEIKMSLVKKRLSMLQNDDDDEEEEVLPVAIEVPTIQYESKSTKKKKLRVNDLCDDDQTIKSFFFKKKLLGRSKLAMKVETEGSSEHESFKSSNSLVERVQTDSSSEDAEFEAADNPKKYIIPRKGLSHDLSEKMESTSMKRAKEFQADLSSKYPSFVKLMSRSHVIQGFWLGIPKKFTNDHLPEHDCTMTLLDENGEKCKAKYLAQKSGLSGGWREFALTRNLLEGDVVVFHLINPLTFKVYTVREDTLGEVDGALGLLNLGGSTTQWISDDHVEELLNPEESPMLLEENIEGGSDVDLGCEVVDGVCFLKTVVPFEGIKTFKNSNIVMDGLEIDSKFTDLARKKYYELCSSQGVFLHEKLVKGLHSQLVVGIILEVINIADAIKACDKACASYDDLRVWEQTLKAFNHLGMNVSFSLERLNCLLGIASEFDVIDESSFREAKLEQTKAKEKLRALEIRLWDLKETMKKVDSEMEAEFQVSARKQECIKKIVDAPW